MWSTVWEFNPLNSVLQTDDSSLYLTVHLLIPEIRKNLSEFRATFFDAFSTFVSEVKVTGVLADNVLFKIFAQTLKFVFPSFQALFEIFVFRSCSLSARKISGVSVAHFRKMLQRTCKKFCQVVVEVPSITVGPPPRKTLIAVRRAARQPEEKVAKPRPRKSSIRVINLEQVHCTTLSIWDLYT